MDTHAFRRKLRLVVIATVLLGGMSPASVQSETYTVADVQSWLSLLGFDPGPIDGALGNRTLKALESFYNSKAQNFDGVVSANEVQDLLSAVKGHSQSGPSTTASVPVSGRSSYSARLFEKTGTTNLRVPELADVGTLLHGINVFDVDRDGMKEVFLCGASYSNFVDYPVTILGVQGGLVVDRTTELFLGDVPTSNDCTAIYFTDLDADGLDDVVYSDSGRDAPPWTGTAIEVALNNGQGFTRITQEFEAATWGIRSYSVAAGNWDADRFGELLLTSGDIQQNSKTIQFRGRAPYISKNPFIETEEWYTVAHASNMQVVDIDGDGRNDIYVGGQYGSPANRIYWSGASARRPSELPDTPLGHYSGNWKGDEPLIRGADVTSSAIADFDLDGDLDIVNVYEHLEGRWNGSSYEMTGGVSSIQILSQTSRRRFSALGASFNPELGYRYYLPALVSDLNSDGLPDVVFNYWRKTDWNFGSTVLMNLGQMRFQKIEAAEIAGYDREIRGMIFPVGRRGADARVMVVQHYPGKMGSRPRRLPTYLATLELR